MRAATRSGRRFTPRVESLEQIQLLSDIAGFYGPMVTNGPKLGYALPGMNFGGGGLPPE